METKASVEPKKGSKKAKKSKTQKKKPNIDKKMERINNFDDPENKYLHCINKKIKNTKKKIINCDNIQEKIDKKVEVHKEELDILNNKEKMIFEVNELEKIIYRFKEIALEEKAERTKQAKEKEKQDKVLKSSFESRSEKLEKELHMKAKSDMDEFVARMNDEFNQRLSNGEKNSEKKAIRFLLEIYFAAKFIESLNEKELNFLLKELNIYMKSKLEHNPQLRREYYFFTEEDLNCFRSFVMQIFPVQKEIDSIKSVKDEFANSTKMIHSLAIGSDDPIDGVSTKFSYRRMGDVTEGIVHSSLFYNRFNTVQTDPNVAKAFMKRGVKELNNFTDAKSYRQMKMTSSDSDDEKAQKALIPKKNDGGKKIKGTNFSIPKTVPVSSEDVSQKRNENNVWGTEQKEFDKKVEKDNKTEKKTDNIAFDVENNEKKHEEDKTKTNRNQNQVKLGQGMQQNEDDRKKRRGQSGERDIRKNFTRRGESGESIRGERQGLRGTRRGESGEPIRGERRGIRRGERRGFRGIRRGESGESIRGEGRGVQGVPRTQYSERGRTNKISDSKDGELTRETKIDPKVAAKKRAPAPSSKA